MTDYVEPRSKRCETCAFWAPDIDSGHLEGQCRIHRPTFQPDGSLWITTRVISHRAALAAGRTLPFSAADLRRIEKDRTAGGSR